MRMLTQNLHYALSAYKLVSIIAYISIYFPFPVLFYVHQSVQFDRTILVAYKIVINYVTLGGGKF